MGAAIEADLPIERARLLREYTALAPSVPAAQTAAPMIHFLLLDGKSEETRLRYLLDEDHGAERLKFISDFPRLHKELPWALLKMFLWTLTLLSSSRVARLGDEATALTPRKHLVDSAACAL